MLRLPQSILQERWTARAESEALLAKVLSLAFTTKRRKDTPSSSGAIFPASFVAGFFLPRDARRSWLDCRRSSLYTDVQQSRPDPSEALLKIEDAIHLAGGPAAGPSK